MASSRGRSTAHKHLLTILQLISSGRLSSYAEPGNPQGDAESLDQKECVPTEAEAGPSKTHLCVVVVEEEEKEISEVLNLPRGKATNPSPPYCSARHEEEANRDPATPPEVESSPPRDTTAEEEDETEQPKRGGYLHLLAEAARVLEPGLGEDEESERGSDGESRKRAAMEAAPGAKLRRRRDWAAAYVGGFEEDIAPVVRSKRGRNQVLPSRYRDSVIEPWKAAARPSRGRGLSDPKR